MPIEYAKERLIIARLVMAIMRARSEHYYPEMGVAASYELQMVATVVFIGHIGRHPMGATEISRYIGMPRVTVLRKLATLIRRGIVVKKGAGYCIVPEAVNRPGIGTVVRGNIRRIRAAAKELSILDENMTSSDT